ncbi:MAG: hypothetical protein AABZ06_04005 [Bdellovibrionota bacterium]
MHVLRLFAAVCILPLSAAAIENNPQNASAKDLASQLKNAVMEETRKLGALESWQKRIFDEEVLTQHQRFIKDYRFSGPNAKVYAEVDVEGLKAYLRFYAPKVITAENFKALVCLRAEAGCDKCMESLKTVKKLVEQMLERRGLAAVFIDAGQIGSDNKAGFEKLTNLARQRKLSAAFLLDWRKTPADDVDSVHADENHYMISSNIDVFGLSSHAARLDLLDSDNFELSATRLLEDTFTILGQKTMSMVGPAITGGSEVLVEVNGIGDYKHFQLVKSQLVSQLKGVSSIEERMIKRDVVSFALMMVNSPINNKEELQKQLSSLKLEPFDGKAPSAKVLTE